MKKINPKTRPNKAIRPNKATFLIKYETADGVNEYDSHFLVFASSLDQAAKIADKILAYWEADNFTLKYKTKEIMEVKKSEIKILQKYLNSSYWNLEDIK